MLTSVTSYSYSVKKVFQKLVTFIILREEMDAGDMAVTSHQTGAEYLIIKGTKQELYIHLSRNEPPDAGVEVKQRVLTLICICFITFCSLHMEVFD